MLLPLPLLFLPPFSCLVVAGAEEELTTWGVDPVLLLLVSGSKVVAGLGILISSPPVKVSEGLVFWELCLDSRSCLEGKLSPSDR